MNCIFARSVVSRMTRNSPAPTQFLAEYPAEHQEPIVTEQSPLVAEAAAEDASDIKSAAAVNPDDVDRTDKPHHRPHRPRSVTEAAAWMSLVQAIYASAEFRFVR
jgi:hypothetical protein